MRTLNAYQSPNQSISESPSSGSAMVLQRATLLLFLGWPIVYWLILADWFQYIPLPLKAGLIGISLALALIQIAMQRGPVRVWNWAVLLIYLFITLQIAGRPSSAEEYHQWRRSQFTAPTASDMR
jgi:hypothetical protein